ncbi:MAG TPA: hypothetical protein VM242_01695, partial [Acidimicrobiales bacterium]|nr:hypothetical protein [Acidimicrobiales bacterium]
TANASVKAGGDIVKAVDTQITTARGVVATQGDAVLSALTQVRTNLPATITASVSGGGETTAGPAVPSTSTGVSATGSASGSASTAPASANLVGSATGSVSALLGGK